MRPSSVTLALPRQLLRQRPRSSDTAFRLGRVSRAQRWSWVAVLLYFFWALPGSAAEITGLIAVESGPVLDAGYEAALLKALPGAQLQEVLTPAQFRARITRAEEIAAELHQARKLLQAADQAMLNMDRARAVRTVREGITHLRRIHSRYHSPELLARANNMLALALLFKPADTIGALQAYREAVKVAPDFQPDMDRTPPRALKLLAQAKQDPRTIRAPSTEELSWLAAKADMDRLIWIAAREAGPGYKLELLVFSAKSGGILTHRQQEVTADQRASRGAKMIHEALNPKAPSLAPPVHKPLTSDLVPATLPVKEKSVEPDPGPAPRPWYKKWWVWTIAGALVAGGTVALVVGLNGGSTTTPANTHPDFIFRY